MKKSQYIIGIAFCIFSFFFGMAIQSKYSKGEFNMNVENKNHETIINQGNGVYYFESRGEEFRHDFSKFITNHPNLKCNALSPITTGNYYVAGYIACFEAKIVIATDTIKKSSL